MKRLNHHFLSWVGVWLFFGVLAAITFRCAWSADMGFASSDVNLGGLAHRKDMGWNLFSGFFTGRPLFGGANQSISFFNVLAQFLPLTSFLELFYGGVLVVGSVAMVWFLRLWSLGWVASVAGALVGFWFNSILLASSGHVYKMEVLVFSVLVLALVEKCVRAEAWRSRVGFALLTGLAVGLMMVEQQDVALLAGLFVGPYALLRLLQAKLGKGQAALLLGLMGGVGLLFAGPVLLKSYDTNIRQSANVQGDAGAKWDYITQWSMVPDEWPDLIAPGWSGWHTGHPEAPYWGRIGQTADFVQTGEGFRNFRLDSSYLGVLSFGLAALGGVWMWRHRKEKWRALVIFWGVACGLGLVLACGRYAGLYRLFFELPLLGDIRAPIKLLDNVQIGLGILSAFGVQALCSGEGIRDRMGKRFLIGFLGVSGVLFLMAAWVYLFPEGWRGRFEQAGFAGQAEGLLRCMSGSWLHAGVCALLGALGVWLAFQKRLLWAGLLLVSVLAVDSVLLTSRYFRAESLQRVVGSNPVLDLLAERQGDERVAFLDQGGVYNSWLAVDGVYRGLNLFNIWQMNRMPVEYEELLRVLGSNPVRLWQLASVRFVTMPEQVLESMKEHPVMSEWFQPVLRYQMPTGQGLRRDVVVRFHQSVPRFGLYRSWQSVPLEAQVNRLAEGTHDPLRSVLVAVETGLEAVSTRTVVEEINPVVLDRRHARLEVAVDERSILRFSQRYQPGWSVWVNGEPADLLRLDFLVMGVALEAGTHVVEFRAPRSRSASYIVGVGFSVLLILGMLMRINRKG